MYANPHSFRQINSLVLFKWIKNSVTLLVLYVNIAGLVLTYEEFSKVYIGITRDVLYVGVNGVSLNHHQFSGKINYGLILYINYVTVNGICLPYQQFYSRVYVGMVYVFYITRSAVMLNHFQFYSLIYRGLILYNSSPISGINYPGSGYPIYDCVILITPSGICFVLEGPSYHVYFKEL